VFLLALKLAVFLYSFSVLNISGRYLTNNKNENRILIVQNVKYNLNKMYVLYILNDRRS